MNATDKYGLEKKPDPDPAMAESFVNVGDRVWVYADPITQKRPEGPATVVEVLSCSAFPQEAECMVVFDEGEQDSACLRTIRPNHLHLDQVVGGDWGAFLVWQAQQARVRTPKETALEALITILREMSRDELRGDAIEVILCGLVQSHTDWSCDAEIAAEIPGDDPKVLEAMFPGSQGLEIDYDGESYPVVMFRDGSVLHGDHAFSDAVGFRP